MARANRADVARLAGVAPSTVSLVLNGHAEQLRISPETVNRVRHAANTLGYVPHAAARSLQARKSRLIGLFMPEFSGDTFAPLVQRVVLQAIAAGRFRDYIVVPILHPLDSATPLAPLLGDLDLAGAVCHIDFADHPLTTALNNVDIPIVYIAPHDAAQQSIGKGLVAINGSSSVAELFNAIDHGDLVAGTLAYVSGPWHSFPLKEYLSAVCPIAPREVVLSASDLDTPHRRLAEFWRRHPNVREVWCSRDVLAVAAHSTARAIGLRVPEDVQIIGFGDQDHTAEFDITSIHWPLKEMTDLALHRLVDALGAGEEDTEIETYTVPMTVRLRGSTRNRIPASADGPAARLDPKPDPRQR